VRTVEIPLPDQRVAASMQERLVEIPVSDQRVAASIQVRPAKWGYFNFTADTSWVPCAVECW